MNPASVEEAQKLLDRLNADDGAWPLGQAADGFQLEGWRYSYEGSGEWTASYYDITTHGWFELV